MWRIQIVNMDGSEISFKGNELDIDYDTAVHYYNHFVTENTCTATYQQYPIRENRKMDLEDKLEQLRTQALIKQNRKMHPNCGLGIGYVAQFNLDVFVGGTDLSKFVQKSTLKNIKASLQEAGIVVLDASFVEDVSSDYESEHPEIMWRKVLETKDEIYYLHRSSRSAENGVKLYSKIGCREHKGYRIAVGLRELFDSINNGVIAPLYIDTDSLNAFFEEETV